jgi:hypothetical protein
MTEKVHVSVSIDIGASTTSKYITTGNMYAPVRWEYA